MCKCGQMINIQVEPGVLLELELISRHQRLGHLEEMAGLEGNLMAEVSISFVMRTVSDLNRTLLDRAIVPLNVMLDSRKINFIKKKRQTQLKILFLT